MNHSNNEEIRFLIDLTITGEADAKQFEEVMSRVENEPEVAKLYQQALAERQLMEGMVPDATRSIEQERERQQQIQQDDDFGLGM